MCGLLLLLRCHDIYIGTFVNVHFPWWFEFHPTQPTFLSKTRFSVDPTIVWLFLRCKQVGKVFHYNKSTTLPLPVPKQSPPIFSWSLILSKWSVNIMSKRQGHEGLYGLSGLVGNCCYDVSDVLSINHGAGNSLPSKMAHSTSYTPGIFDVQIWSNIRASRTRSRPRLHFHPNH